MGLIGARAKNGHARAHFRHAGWQTCLRTSLKVKIAAGECSSERLCGKVWVLATIGRVVVHGVERLGQTSCTRPQGLQKKGATTARHWSNGCGGVIRFSVAMAGMREK